MSLQKFLRTLRTSLNLQSSSSSHGSQTLAVIFRTLTNTSLTPLFSELSPASLRLILTDPLIHTSTCFHFFNFLLGNQSLLSFEPDLHSHLILICRLLEASSFVEAENMLKSVSVDQIQRYPFSAISSSVENCSANSWIGEMFFNCALKIYSENGLFNEALMVFEYMKSRGIRVKERHCTMHLFALKRSGNIWLCLEFFHRMLESGIAISVYSLTVIVDGLCCNGDIETGRRLIEEMSSKDIAKPNVVTFNILIAACSKRWKFAELDLVLALMEKEGVAFNLASYKFLIDGFTSSGKAAEAERLLLEMHEKGLKVDAHIYDLIINSYCKSGSTKDARRLFDEMSEREVAKTSDTIWALLNGLLKAGEMEEVKRTVDEIKRKGIELDPVMQARIVHGFCKKGMIHVAHELQGTKETQGSDDSVSPSHEERPSESKKEKRKEELLMLFRTMKRFNRN